MTHHWKQILHKVLKEASWEYSRSSGPGGQNVNKVESKATLRWSLYTSLSFEEIDYVIRHLRGRLTKSGELVISSERYRDRERNRADVIEKLHVIFEKSFFIPPTRKKTKPTKSSKEKRLKNKEKRKDIKKLRQKIKF